MAQFEPVVELVPFWLDYVKELFERLDKFAKSTSLSGRERKYG